MVSNVVLTSLIASYLYQSLLSLHLLASFSLNSFKNPAQPCYKCCSLSVNLVVNVRFTMNGMCVENNTHVAWTSRNKMSTTWDRYCCLLRQWEVLRTCCWAFPVTTKWCFDQDVKVVSCITFTKKRYNRCGSLQKRGGVIATSPLALHWKCGFRMPNQRWSRSRSELQPELAFQAGAGVNILGSSRSRSWSQH